MKTDELDYDLPRELIAQMPADKRDSSRLLHCPKESGPFTDHIFSDILNFLKAGDVLVMNTAKVSPMRLFGYKYPSGARIEILLLEKLTDGENRYRGLMKRRRRLEPGDIVLFPESKLMAEIIESDAELGEDIVELSGVEDVPGEIESTGRIPLPPYISEFEGDIGRYQTVYARTRGSVAAPTAGLHFTDELLRRIDEMGVKRAQVHLRVGWGTFNPIRTDEIEEHKLHAEEGEISAEDAEKINVARKNGGRVVAVGTTVTRLLETSVDSDGVVHPFSGATDLYITPGYECRAVDVLVTNFHLPRSSLLALVMAFLGTERTMEAYEYAIELRYRFYSFGDAMIID